MSIKTQAEFYLRNVCDYNDICNEYLSDSVKEGFAQFSSLLRTLYGDFHSYEVSTVPSEPTKIGIMTDDLENYHNLVYTVECLYSIALTGELRSKGALDYLCIPKSLFKNSFKKSVTLPFEMLEKYGFGFEYYKDGKEVSEYRRCNTFNVFYENGDKLIGSIKFIAKRLSEAEKKKEMPDKVAFMLSDYHFIMKGEINQDPLNELIFKTIGNYGALWKKIVSVMCDECGLKPEMSFNPYVFPNRTVTFKKDKKTVCKFGINVDNLSVRLPLSFETAKELILKRETLPQSINDNIDKFGCVSCGRCGTKNSLEYVNGVPLCTLPYTNFITEDSRCLRFVLTNEEEADVINNIVRTLYKK